jgi:hypothetical protein
MGRVLPIADAVADGRLSGCLRTLAPGTAGMRGMAAGDDMIGRGALAGGTQPDRSVSNDLLTGPWVRPVATYAGVATVSLAGFLRAQNGAAGHDRTSRPDVERSAKRTRSHLHLEDRLDGVRWNSIFPRDLCHSA